VRNYFCGDNTIGILACRKFLVIRFRYNEVMLDSGFKRVHRFAFNDAVGKMKYILSLHI
jgi:hypothetical protein